MQCPSNCGSTRVLSEGVGENKVKITCQECGASAVRDDQGRRMLTDDMSSERHDDQRRRLDETSA